MALGLRRGPSPLEQALRCTMALDGIVTLSDLRLALAELGDLVAIATGGDAAPLAAVVFGGVVEVEDAGGGVGAAVEVLDIGLGEEVGNQAGENRESQFFALEY